MQKVHSDSSDKPIVLYNLDVVISVGYRVNSARGTQFRIWATGALRDHLPSSLPRAQPEGDSLAVRLVLGYAAKHVDFYV